MTDPTAERCTTLIGEHRYRCSKGARGHAGKCAWSAADFPEPVATLTAEQAREEGAANAREDAAAIRSALAEIDRLNAENADLRYTVTGLHANIADRDKEIEDLRSKATELQDLFNICDGERIFLRESVTDLEARAIPRRWVEDAMRDGWLHIDMRTTIGMPSEGIDVNAGVIVLTSVDRRQTTHTTLAAALKALESSDA